MRNNAGDLICGSGVVQQLKGGLDDGVGRDALQASVMTFRTDALIAKPAWNVFEEDAVGHPPRRMLWVGEGVEVDHRCSGC